MHKNKGTLAAVEDYDGTWSALGKTFRRKGQAEKYIRQNGFKVGKPQRYGFRWSF